MENSRNLILAILLSAIVIFGWSYVSERLFPAPPPPPVTAGAGAGAGVGAAGPGTQAGTPASPGLAAGAGAIRTREAALKGDPRVPIRTGTLEGSVNLVGARIDDLVLRNYRETIKKDSQPIHLFSPSGTKGEYLASFGFAGAPGLPGPDTRWELAGGDVLAPGKPIVLRHTNAAAQTFEITLSVDQGYMFTATQRIINRGGQAAVAQPYALVTRIDPDEKQDQMSLHTGPVGAFNDAHFEENWSDLRDAEGGVQTYNGSAGWVGFADQYWLAALVPDQQTPVTATLRHSAPNRFQTDITRAPMIVAPGTQAAQTFRLFAGAKEVDTLETYQKALGIPMFEQANDWGTFGFLARPMFHLLSWLYSKLGNYGLAIISLTFLVRLALFPIANKQYSSMNKLRVLAPKMKEMQDRYKNDKEGLQKAMMEFYQKEKVNPVAGCLPLLLQMPIFFALYKCFILSIEMRHAPFALWIRDLSAPDPVSPINLFGLLPFTPPAAIALGILPILVGVTMYLQQKLNPPMADPMQQKIFAFMPWIFMIFMAPFAAGLQLYWFTNNVLSIAQQWWLMKKHPTPAASPAAAK